jgi:16S rRNA (adenine1518-N6/adenine1519-N6)-dimethyltransferase
VFYPVPNVDSALLRLRRRPAGAGPPEPSPELRGLIAGAFAHRRKTLAGSLALSGALGGRSREQVRHALERVGHRADVRAERLSPQDFRALARALEL